MGKKTARKNNPQQKKPQPSSPTPGIRPIKKSRQEQRFFYTYWRELAVISVFAIGLYFQSISFDYVLDDSILIVENKFTQSGISGIGDIFRYESFKGHFGDQKEMVEGGRYRPLSIASFAIEKSMFGGSPAIAHFINVLLYALTGILLFRLLLLMFPIPSANKWYFSIPFVAVLLFIVHPLHVEVIGNVKGRDEIFALLAEIGILYFSLKYAEYPARKYLLYSFICFFLGILSKEGVITFLAIAPVTLHFFSNSSLSTKIKITLPLLAGAVLYLILRYNAIGYLLSGAEITNLMNNPFYGMSFGEKTATVFYTLLLYLKLLVVPHPLTHDYYPYHIPVMDWTNWASLLSLALYITLLVVAIKGWKNKTVPAYAILFYLTTLSIVSNLFISIGTFMNERFVYHASLGFCIGIAWLLVEKMHFNRVAKRVAMGIFLIATIAFSVKTLVRLPDWKTIEALDRSAIKVSTNSARANHFFGILIWNNNYMKLPPDASPSNRKAILDSAKPFFDRAVQILPSYNSANSMKAGIAAEYHKLDNNYAALIKSFEEVNLTGTYEKFVLEYLHFVNPRVNTQKDARLLEAFYKRMIAYYDVKFKNTNLPGEYRSLLKEIERRLPTMQP